MGRIGFWSIVFAVALMGAGVPTPPPGTGTPVVVPAPNPLDYNAVSGATISSSQYNSNFWKSYNDINAIAGALNSCAYADGNGVTAVAATLPLVASIGACNPGVGTTLTLSLSGGVPVNATHFTASDTAGTGDYFWFGSGSVVGHQIGLDDDATGNVGGVPCEAYRFTDFALSRQLMCGDGFGDAGFLGSTIAKTVNSRPGGVTTYTVPFDANSSGGDTNSHTEWDVFYVNPALPASTCVTTGLTSFHIPYSTDPFLSFTPSGVLPVVVTLFSETANDFAARVCNVSPLASTNVAVRYFATGE